MSRPGNRFFIGPLTPAQQERRRRARYRGNDATENQYAYNVTFLEGLRIADRKRRYPFSTLLAS